ncbi:MAG TPA: hypothetical protein VFR59_07615, partial [Steroidobacteraceae bacterium]|nr:hypothetical protein [Steroidobacteraceae bacterium]
MSLLPERALPRVDALSQAPRDADLSKLDALMIVVPQDIRDAAWSSLPRGAWLREERSRRALTGGATLSARLDNEAHTLLIVGLLPRDASAFVALKLAGQMLKEIAAAQATRVGAYTVALPAQASQRALEALVAATLAAGFDLPSFKSAPRNAHL